jgi:uncharacterized damage-inducible protein DinB
VPTASEPNVYDIIGDGWSAYQRKLVEAIAPLDDAGLALRPAAHLWSVRMLASHVVGARVWWFQEWMGEGGQEMREFAGWDDDEQAQTRGAAELVRGLEASWSMVEACLRRLTLGDLDEDFQRPEPNPTGRHRTRRWILWHVAEHDLHHGGEISFCLGMHGRKGVEL